MVRDGWPFSPFSASVRRRDYRRDRLLHLPRRNEASRHAPTSAAIAIGFVLISQGFWMQVSHHWLCMLFVMIAVWMTLRADRAPEGDRTHALIAGAAIGMATMILPTVGALTALAALTAFVGPRCGALLIGCALVPLALIAYEAEQGALFAAFDQVILFSARRYAVPDGTPSRRRL